LVVSPTAESKSIDSLEQTVTHLFDAVRYSEQVAALKIEAKLAAELSKARISKLEGVEAEVSGAVNRLSEQEKSEYVNQMATQIKEFVKAAVEQARTKALDEAQLELAEIESQDTSVRTKLAKSLESYFVSNPLPLMDLQVDVKMGESGYDAQAKYTCKGGVSYRFSLATQNSKFFHRGFRLAALGRKLNLPVELQRNWLKKEPAPRYEKLERYDLREAEVTDRHIIVEFFNEESKASVRISSAGAEGEGLPTIEYTEDGTVTNITTDTGLNKFVDSKEMTASIRQLRSEILSLEKNKVALSDLNSKGEEVLESLNCTGLLGAILKLMGPSYRQIVQSLASKPMKSRNGEMSLSLIKERIALLGPSASIAIEGLGLK
jgi:hypothetical protein